MAIKDVYIRPKPQQESGLDKILKGLSVVQGVVGTYEGIKDIQAKLEAQKAAKEAADEAKLKEQKKFVSTKDILEAQTKGYGIEKADADAPDVYTNPAGQMIRLSPPKPKEEKLTPYQSEQLKLERERLGTAKQEKEMTKAEKQAALEVPGYGVAKTADDAKKLKEGLDNKRNMEAAVDRLIELRQQYGAEMWNRDVVSEAQRLATDIKLTAKNMAQLGVLSKSDEMLLARIIPDDPTRWNTFEKVTGQDSILTGLQQYKKEQNNKFENMLKSRLATNAPAQAQSGPKPGATENGYRFKGGNPADPKNWEKLK